MSSPAARSRHRKYRRRQKFGLISLRVEICENTLAAALIASGRLDERQALCRGELEQQAGVIIREWAERWRWRDTSLC